MICFSTNLKEISKSIEEVKNKWDSPGQLISDLFDLYGC